MARRRGVRHSNRTNSSRRAFNQQDSNVNDENLSQEQTNSEPVRVPVGNFDRLRRYQSRINGRRQQNADSTSRRRATNQRNMAARRSAETGEETERRQQNDRLSRQGARIFDWNKYCLSAFNYFEGQNFSEDQVLKIGKMDSNCSHCNARKFINECAGMCCDNGRIQLPLLGSPPEPLFFFLNDPNFLSKIRCYNGCFQMTSFGCSERIIEPGFMPTFRIQGQVYHRVGSLFQNSGETNPQFLQIYFMGDDELQVSRRCEIFDSVNPAIVSQLQRMLTTHNSYIVSFQTALENYGPNNRLVIHADRTPHGEHERRYNAPSCSEVAVIMAGDPTGVRDIIIKHRGTGLNQILDTNRAYDALQYPLIFWSGQDGYHLKLFKKNNLGVPLNKLISSMEFYSFFLMVRDNDFNHILRFASLLNQFVVDMYAKIESERCRYLKLNQQKLRVEEYIHLRDAISNDGNVNNLGQLVILPSTFIGGPRYMQERTQDAMTYVRKFGKPDLFITFTCNPKWDEIRNELFPGQEYHFRHDLIARVFRLKVKLLIKFLKVGKAFGELQCFMYTIEWQKRGLPHAHLLLWLKTKIQPEQMDSIISAELPDEQRDPVLFAIVKTQMVHGPCGPLHPSSPCMRDGKCSKRFPKQFLNESISGNDGYPLYRRRSPQNGGVQILNDLRGGAPLDNRWIVPYSPLLCKIFNAHINVELCSSVRSIKYVCKYVNKGSDMAVFGIQRNSHEVNEIDNYLTGRYLSSNESFWRIFNFPIHERYPTVTHLVVHLENGQRVFYNPENISENTLESRCRTTLTAFFELCQRDEFAQILLYNEVPSFYTFNKASKTWNRRRMGHDVVGYRGVKKSDAIGRVYAVHPRNSECYHLRLLLHQVRGPKSFDDLRTVNGHVCETFKESCYLRDLLDSDSHLITTLDDAVARQSPTMIRQLFAVILFFCDPANPMELWLKYRDFLSEDFYRHARNRDPNVIYSDAIYNQALIQIDNIITNMGGSGVEAAGLPQITRTLMSVQTDVLRELSYNIDDLDNIINRCDSCLVHNQRIACDLIIDSVVNKSGKIFFLDAPGGTGKTYLLNLILAKVRRLQKIAIAVASSGIASTLLMGGRTSHSMLKIPIRQLNRDAPICHVGRGSSRAELLKMAELLVWDESTMSNKTSVDAVNHMLKDIRQNDANMGGMTVVFAGDFRQTLPIIPRGTRADTVNASIKKSDIWPHINILRLDVNMRAHITGDNQAAQFSEKLLTIGNGQFPAVVPPNDINVRNIGINCSSVEDLIHCVFPDISNRFQELEWVSERAILAPRNISVDDINKKVLSLIPGMIVQFKSIDTVIDTDEAVNFPTEFLNTLSPCGFPSHILELKIGCPIILLRNLDPPNLCNGTRLVVRGIYRWLIEATIITGPGKGNQVFIPRIPLVSEDGPFSFKRNQFPIRLCFGMSINKSQGQSLKVAGLYLENPCFSHGQFYVGCSRVGSEASLYIHTGSDITKNIVYREALI